MALILSKALATEEKKTWQAVKVSYPKDDGFTKGSFKAQFIVPDSDAVKDQMETNTIREVLELYFVGAKGLQATPEDKSEVEFTDELKEQLLNTTYIQTAIWDSFMLTMKGGKAKN